MRRRNKDELMIYPCESDVSHIYYKEIISLFREIPADIIYFTNDEKLVGIFCLEDAVSPNLNGVVPVMTSFLRTHGWKDEEARSIFSSKANIRKVPVIDDEGKLLGDYSKWLDGDERCIDFLLWENNGWKFLKKFQRERCRKLLILRPCSMREHLLKKFEKKLSELGVSYEIVDEIVENALCIAINEDEKRGRTFERELAYGGFDDSEFLTIRELLNQLDEFGRQESISHYSVAGETGASKAFRDLEAQGVHVLCFYNDVYYMTPFIRDAIRQSISNYKQYPITHGESWPKDTQMFKKFYDGLLDQEDYRAGIAQQMIQEGHGKHKPGVDFENRYYRIEHGIRRTCFQPKEYTGSIYFYGDCLIMGGYIEDQYTIESWLQKMLCDVGSSYRVVNLGSYENTFGTIRATTFHKGDIVIVYTGESKYDEIDGVEIRHVFEKYRISADNYTNSFSHMNHLACEAVAREMCECIKPIVCAEYRTEWKNKEIHFLAEKAQDIFGRHFLKTYLERMFDMKKMQGDFSSMLINPDVSPEEQGRMIHNILEEERNKLIVFIPQDVTFGRYDYDELLFGLMTLFFNESRVVLISGDRYVPFSSIFSDFYTKRSNDRVMRERQAKEDAHIFAECVAEPLHIRRHYVVVDGSIRSRTYGNAMKSVLPAYGIKTVEIEKEDPNNGRKSLGGFGRS